MTRRAGIDVGGTKCLGVVLDEGGEIVAEHRLPTPKGPDAIIDTLADLVGHLGDVDSLGVGVPGLVTRNGVLKAAPNLIDITDFQVGALLSERIGFPVEVEYRASALGRSTHYTLGYDYSEAPKVLSWKMVRGDIMRTIDGAYHFGATSDGGTEVRYDLAIELVVPLPGFVKRRAEVRILNTVRELKARAELTQVGSEPAPG